MLLHALIYVLALLSACDARPRREYNSHPFASALQARQSEGTANSSLQVDLGYAIYEGSFNSTTGLNNWQG